MALLGFIPACACGLLFLASPVRFTDDVFYGGIFPWRESQYRYEHVDRIFRVTEPSGKRFVYRVTFDDGKSWGTAMFDTTRPKPAQLEDAMAFLSRKTGKPIEDVTRPLE